MFKGWMLEKCGMIASMFRISMETEAPMAIDPNAIATALSICNCEKKKSAAVFVCFFVLSSRRKGSGLCWGF